MLEKTRKLLDGALESQRLRTEEEAQWYLAYRYAESMREDGCKGVAHTIQTIIEHGISYDALEADFLGEIEGAKLDGSWVGDFEDCLTESIRNFYDID